MSKKKNKCTICGSVGVNRSTCPLYVKNPSEKDWKKHPKAKKKTQQKPAEKPAAKPPRRPIPSKYTNPYTSITQLMCNTTRILLNQIKPNIKIVLRGKILKILQFRINNPKYKLEIHNTAKNRKKLREYLQLFCDIHRQLHSLSIDRVDFFTRPSISTQKILELRDSAKALFIKFLIDSINPSGGTPDHIDINQPVDELLEGIQLLNILPDVTMMSLPEAPNGKIETDPLVEQQKITIAVPNKDR
jgi:hypothetical protein